MSEMHPTQARLYRIHIKGQIPERWAVWFDSLRITYTDMDETILSGLIADQAALHGLLGKIRDLNLTLLSINLEAENER